jgi:hypothetical protein
MGISVYVCIVDTPDAFTEAVQSIDAHNKCADWNSRGEDIHTDHACLVAFAGSIWLQVTNSGGGGRTWDYLTENHPEVDWMGKPNGFNEAPVVSGVQPTSWHQLRRVHDKLVGIPLCKS